MVPWWDAAPLLETEVVLLRWTVPPFGPWAVPTVVLVAFPCPSVVSTWLLAAEPPSGPLAAAPTVLVTPPLALRLTIRPRSRPLASAWTVTKPHSSALDRI